MHNHHRHFVIPLLILLSTLHCITPFSILPRQQRQQSPTTITTTTSASSPLHMSIPTPLDTLTTGLASTVRLPLGTTARPKLKSFSGAKIYRFYHLENDPDCRLVREYITELDLNIDEVLFDKRNIPRMVLEYDNGNRITVTGIDMVMNKLKFTFEPRFSSSSSKKTTKSNTAANSKGYVPPPWTSNLASKLRFRRGKYLFKGALPTNPDLSQPVKLYNYENNQFCRLVREVLTELNLKHTLLSAGKGSPRRAELAAISGATTCPYLIDPNTNVSMGESSDIIRYLYQTYAYWIPPNENLRYVSHIVSPKLKPFLEWFAPLQVGDLFDEERIKTKIQSETYSAPVVIYTYKWSPYCKECKSLFENLNIPYKEISLGAEWLPGMIARPKTRLMLFQLTNQTSLPHVFVGGQSVGGLFSGNTGGVVKSLERGEFLRMVERAERSVGISSTRVRD